MIISLQNDMKFTEIGPFKEKLLSLRFPLATNPNFLLFFCLEGVC